MEDEITYKLNLDKYRPWEIVEMHQLGVLTLEEIIDSGRMWSEFGDTLKNYVYEMTSIRNIKLRDAMEKTLISNTRMVTHWDRKLIG